MVNETVSHTYCQSSALHYQNTIRTSIARFAPTKNGTCADDLLAHFQSFSGSRGFLLIGDPESPAVSLEGLIGRGLELKTISAQATHSPV